MSLFSDYWDIRDGMEKINRGRRGKYMTTDDWDEFIRSVQIGDCIEIQRKHINHWCIFVGPHFYSKENKCDKKWYDKKIQQVVHINGNSRFGSASYSPSANGKSNIAQIDFFIDVVKDSKFRINNDVDLMEEPRPIDNILTVLGNEMIEANSSYNFFMYNCEHFVKFVRNNIRSCGQIETVISVVGTIVKTCLAVVPIFLRK
uniref:Retinoic acid receptor responder protein 3 n=1 Tax=Lepeophtheirus salmonis TaxID=72036 RepID=C1BTZ1_LEPSM|nr:Retinoic acid receptor responder protein 3 [Lepeophtheirus salmonis]